MESVAQPSFLASRTQDAPDGIGKPVRRKEDARLLTGAGRFGDDVSLPGQAYAAFVRSPHAHAGIVVIGTTAPRPRRHSAGGMPVARRNARLNAASES